MSRGIEAYLVRPDTLRAAIGSADAGVVFAAGEARLSDADREAAVGLIHGQQPGDAPARALRALCQVVGGKMLPNDQWMPFRGSYLDVVDQALADAGVEARASDLAWGLSGTPALGVDLPFEVRAVGYSTTDVRTMHARFAGAERVAEDVRDAVQQAAGWFAQAVDAGLGLLVIEV